MLGKEEVKLTLVHDQLYRNSDKILIPNFNLNKIKGKFAGHKSDVQKTPIFYIRNKKS